MSLRTAISLCLLFFLPAQKVFCTDSDTISSAIQQNSASRQTDYQERVYVSLDKNFYLSGEYLRFKVYCLDVETNLTSPLSKVAYLELLDTGNNSVIQTKIQLINGIGYGDIFIPSNFKSGNYVFRCYTKWMRNFDADKFYHSIIQIVNPFKRAGLMPEPESDKITLQFFPEGGSLVYGFKSKIAFRARDASDKGIDFLGIIIDDLDSTILEFSPLESGLGSFFLKPVQNRSYHAKIMLTDSSENIYKLPEINYKGYVMRVENINDQDISIEVKSGNPSLNENMLLTGLIDGKILFTSKFIIENCIGSVRINLEGIDPGIMQIILINSQGQMLNQRQVFIYPKEKINLNIKTDKKTYYNREKIIVKVSAKDLEQIPVNMDLSISVSVYNPQFEKFSNDISSYFLFNRGMKGFVEKSPDYFDGESSKYRMLMDNIMLTDSNYDYSQEDIQNNKRSIKYIPEFRHHIVTGKLTNNISNLPEEGIIAYLSIPSNKASFFAAQSNQVGKLFFEISDLQDMNKVIIQTDYTKDTNYKIELDAPFSKDFSDFSIPRFDLDEGLHEFIEKTSKNMQIQNAYLKYSPLNETNYGEDSSTFYEPDATYYLDDYTRFQVMEEVMREYVGGVYVRRNQDGFHFKILDLDRTETFQENPLILLDGVTIFDANEIMDLDPLIIKKIETVRKRFIKDGFNYSGIVSFFTYNGDLHGYQLHDRAQLVEYDGVQAMRHYVSPEYLTKSDLNSRIPDYRNVLFWDPQFQTDNKGEATLEFYTSDDVSEYEIRVEGISSDGRIAYSNSFIQVVDDVE